MHMQIAPLGSVVYAIDAAGGQSTGSEAVHGGCAGAHAAASTCCGSFSAPASAD